MTGIYGIDVSNNNGALVSVVHRAFVIAKATEGTGFTDDTFAGYVHETEMTPNVVHFGAYHFFHAENRQARAEARHFCSIAKPQSERSLWLDYETYSDNAQADAEEIGYFIDEVKVNFPKAKVGIYANSTGLGRIFPYLSEIPFNGFWYANPSIPVDHQSTGLGWQIHQYGSIGGIDQNYWSWDAAKIKQYYAWT